ncbi:bifunctional DNA-formamidopyrimidine glycosylase/DNA-(apurinic or apyrimidinic site) lyase [Thalassotalea atypica]|uniref:bifunctional DNA-formamidopyrimidine glycosylase/DNA-(apurinic or apyrimidinic site) lyase n=1 Tax=Thalassotalea atypica TaxID=2054316 RepID=UPI0025744499|nr:bifunctional DNA-formamidopyrimidine glycosylase/DNA-(apurinic or apyrimidinic site) lyase [Thalassotalea atypica]
MPELPEVEVCRLGITPHVINKKVLDVIVRHWQLRWPIPEQVLSLKGLELLGVERRSKYLILKFATGSLLIHLGMSGTIRVIEHTTPVIKHDHFDLMFEHGKALRLNDPRRFGAVLWLENHQDTDNILAKLGPEPLSSDFGPGYLFSKAKNRKVPVKTFIMNNDIVVGVGNIYANEALFKAGILPTAPVGKLSQKRFNILTEEIKRVLKKAIEQGGTTLKDFTQADGKPGYFAQSLDVYGRAGQPCVNCNEPLKEVRQSNRSSVYCANCQTK